MPFPPALSRHRLPLQSQVTYSIDLNKHFLIYTVRDNLIIFPFMLFFLFTMNWVLMGNLCKSRMFVQECL